MGRWYNHIKSFGAGMKQLAKASKNAADYTTGGAAPASNDDDDDVDLFGSDDEEDSEEKKRITEERLKAYAEKKSKKPALIAKTSCLFDLNLGMTKLTWTKCSSCARLSRWMVFFGVLASLSQSGTASRSCSSCAWLKTPKSPSTSCKKRCVTSRTTFSQWM